MPHSVHSRALTLFIKFILAGFVGVLLLVSIGNIGVFFTPNWPFELFISYARHLLILSPIVGLLFLIFWRDRTLFFLVVMAAAFWPLAISSKYQKPTHKSCDQTACIRILSGNLRGRVKALENLAEIARQTDFDVVGIYELPYGITDADLHILFPQYKDIYKVTHAPDGRALGSIMAIVSKHKLRQKTITATTSSGGMFAPRAFISAELETQADSSTRIYAVHPRLPLSKLSQRQRDELLHSLKTNIGTADNFIVMGDFNLTPWTPAFRELPGTRAGAPRLTYTWDAQRPWLGIPIDHILIGSDYEVVEADVLPDIGSDHRPIIAVVAVKN